MKRNSIGLDSELVHNTMENRKEDEEKKDVIIEMDIGVPEAVVTPKEEVTSLLTSPLFWFTIAAVSSIGMTIFNKRLTKAFPYPFVLISIQNFASVLFFILVQFISKEIFPIKQLKLNHFIICFLPTIGYSLILWTSLEGLSRVSIPLIIVFRNITPLIVSLVENLMNSKSLQQEESISLSLVFIGSIGYALSDFTLSLDGKIKYNVKGLDGSQ
jgi:drug/metabolite transporter (DMT)-like permease